MRGVIAAGWLVAIAFGVTASAEQLMLSVERRGYEVESPVPISEGPEPERVWQVQVVLHPGQAYKSIVVLGNRRIEISGQVKAASQGGYDVNLRVHEELDTGTRVLVAPNVFEPLPEITTVSGSPRLGLGVPVVVGGLNTGGARTTPTGALHRKSQCRYVATLCAAPPDELPQFETPSNGTAEEP